MVDAPVRRQPTINDLRIKLCYICREEELHNNPEDPPRRWVHPCKCTLIAHEACLLEWIRTAEENPRKKATDILKCPQCGAGYEMLSEQTRALRLLDKVNLLLSSSGRMVVACVIGSFVVAFGGGIYLIFTTYGALALRRYIGDELYQYLLTDDPTNWPVMAWFDLPLIPISLILGRSALSNLASFNHAFILWPMVMSRAKISSVSGPLGRFFVQPIIDAQSLEPGLSDILFSWPPSPAVFTLGFNIISKLYIRYYRRIRRRILGQTGSQEEENVLNGGVRRLLMENWHVEVHVDAEIGVERPEEEGEAPAPVPDPANGDAQVPEGQPDEAVNVEILPLENEVPNPVVAEAEERVNPVLPQDEIIPEIDPEANDQPGPQPDAAPAPAPLPPAIENENENPDLLPRNANVRITGSILGRVIGSALIIPFISSGIGQLLLRLSHRSTLLRRFLAVRPPGNAALAAALGMRVYDGMFDQMYDVQGGGAARAVKTVWLALKFGVCFAGVGSPVWRKADPVWWRSTLGLGIYVVTRDAVSLYYLWLQQRERRTRTLKNRSFEGIDPAELDLIPDRIAEIA